MGMGISQKLGMGWREWELNRWEWEGMGMLKAIPAHLYYGPRCHTVLFTSLPKSIAADDLSC